MVRSMSVLAVLAMLGCNKDKADDTGTETTETTEVSCDVTVDSTVPTDGATDAYYRGAIEFHLSESDASATASLADSAGAAVAGSQVASDDGSVIHFFPDAPLASSSSYTASLSYCDGDNNPSISFTTDALGGALEADVTGKVYVLDLTTARFVYPEGVADLLLGQLENDILIGVNEVTDSTIAMAGAISDDAGEQDYCQPSIALDDADFSEAPYFSVEAEVTTLDVAGMSIALNNLVINGTFSSDGSYFGGGVLGAQLDARDLGAALKSVLGTDDPDEICTLLIGFGVACEECNDGSPYCVGILADQMVAAEKGGDPLACVDESYCHPMCETNECEDATVGECE